MLHTTFALLHEHNACEQGYKKLAKALGGVTRYGEHTPIPLSHIVETNDVQDALWCLRATSPGEAVQRDRLSRLFACDCAEHVLHFFEEEYPKDKRPRQAIEAARMFADGAVNARELATARDAAWDATRAAAWDAARYAVWSTAGFAAGDAAWDAAGDAAWDAAGYVAWDAARAAAWDAAGDAVWSTAWATAWDAEYIWQQERFLAYLNGTEGRNA